MHTPRRPTKADITPPSAPRPDAVQLRARRSPRLIALGVVLVVLGGLGSAALYGVGTDQHTAVVMRRDVGRGDAIEQADLAVVEVPRSLAVDTVPGDKLEGLLGGHALTDLPRGAFPLPHHIGDDPLPPGTSLVGLRLPLGRLPVSPLPPGTTLRLVALAEGSELLVDAVVASSPTPLDDGITFAFDVRVAVQQASEVARLSAAEQLAVVVVKEP